MLDSVILILAAILNPLANRRVARARARAIEIQEREKNPEVPSDDNRGVESLDLENGSLTPQDHSVQCPDSQLPDDHSSSFTETACLNAFRTSHSHAGLESLIATNVRLETLLSEAHNPHGVQ